MPKICQRSTAVSAVLWVLQLSENEAISAVVCKRLFSQSLDKQWLIPRQPANLTPVIQTFSTWKAKIKSVLVDTAIECKQRLYTREQAHVHIPRQAFTGSPLKNSMMYPPKKSIHRKHRQLETVFFLWSTHFHSRLLPNLPKIFRHTHYFSWQSNYQEACKAHMVWVTPNTLLTIPQKRTRAECLSETWSLPHSEGASAQLAAANTPNVWSMCKHSLNWYLITDVITCGDNHACILLEGNTNVVVNF